MKYPCHIPLFMSIYTSVTFYYLFFLPIHFTGQVKPTISNFYKAMVPLTYTLVF